MLITVIPNNIELDGSFEDSVDKSFVSDSKRDSCDTWKDFVNVGYFADDEYLYLKVERQSSNKSEPWQFYVVMLNATEGNPIEQYHIYFTRH